jgi:hypothetical protein
VRGPSLVVPAPSHAMLGREHAMLLQTLVVLWPDVVAVLRSRVVLRQDVAMLLPWFLVLRGHLAVLPG